MPDAACRCRASAADGDRQRSLQSQRHRRQCGGGTCRHARDVPCARRVCRVAPCRLRRCGVDDVGCFGDYVFGGRAQSQDQSRTGRRCRRCIAECGDFLSFSTLSRSFVFLCRLFGGRFPRRLRRRPSPSRGNDRSGTGLSAILLPKLNLLALGDDIAFSLGVAVRPLRFGALLLASLLAGAVVSFAGRLGFVGLIVPHIARRPVGHDVRRLYPVCILGGALLVVLSDLAARTLFSPAELPAGILMAAMGAPFFLYLLFRRSRWGEGIGSVCRSDLQAERHPSSAAVSD